MFFWGHHTISLTLNVIKGKLSNICSIAISRNQFKEILGKIIYICVYKISFKSLNILKSCISMIFQFPFKYSFLNVAGVFWQIMGKGLTWLFRGKFRNILQWLGVLWWRVFSLGKGHFTIRPCDLKWTFQRINWREYVKEKKNVDNFIKAEVVKDYVCVTG